MRKASLDSRPVSVEKTFFDLSKGFVTELSPLGMPGGTTIDESNFEILRDGTRRRRKGIYYESGGIDFDFASDDSEIVPSTSHFNQYRWQGVNNNPNLTFICIKLGHTLHFYIEDDTLSTHKITDVVDLASFSTAGVTTSTSCPEISDYDITMSSMHGRLFVAGKYLNPIYIVFDEIAYTADPTTVVFQPHLIDFRIRDLLGIEDGVGIGVKPKTLSEDHAYNLVNRGWNTTTINTFFAGKKADSNITSKEHDFYPAKNQIWWKALIRYSSGGYENSISDLHKLRVFDTNAIEQEVFGTTSAPQGHLFLNPFDTTAAVTYGVQDSSVITRAITACTVTLVSGGTSTQPDGTVKSDIKVVITVDNTTDPWGNNDDVTIEGLVLKLNLYQNHKTAPNKTVIVDLSGGIYELSNKTGSGASTTFNIHYYYSGAKLAQYPFTTLNSVVSLGVATTGGIYPKSTSYTTGFRPTAVTTAFGRAWYAGVDHSELADTIFYSQIGNSTVDGAKAYGKMFQQYDPTEEYLNITLASDGGTIQIPGLVGVKALIPIGPSVLVLARTGIWEISGGDTFFSAININVRKIAEAEVVSTNGWALTDSGLIVASPRGLFVISDNDQSGRLSAKSLTLDSIQTYWQTILPQNLDTMQLHYDNALYRLYILFKRIDTSTYTKCTSGLVFDLPHNSFYKLDFPAYDSYRLHGACVINDTASVNDNKKLKFFVLLNTTGSYTGQRLQICDMSQENYYDFDGSELVPFIETGYDGIGEANYRAQQAAQAAPDHGRHRYSPYIHVFMKRTESMIGEAVFNESSLSMEAHWDFASDITTGKVGSPQQVYRPRSDALTELPMAPVVISKNKARGRGRALHLKFTGEVGKDAHLLGYSIEYKGERKA